MLFSGASFKEHAPIKPLSLYEVKAVCPYVSAQIRVRIRHTNSRPPEISAVPFKKAWQCFGKLAFKLLAIFLQTCGNESAVKFDLMREFSLTVWSIANCEAMLCSSCTHSSSNVALQSPLSFCPRHMVFSDVGSITNAQTS